MTTNKLKLILVAPRQIQEIVERGPVKFDAFKRHLRQCGFATGCGAEVIRLLMDKQLDRVVTEYPWMLGFGAMDLPLLGALARTGSPEVCDRIWRTARHIRSHLPRIWSVTYASYRWPGSIDYSTRTLYRKARLAQIGRLPEARAAFADKDMSTEYANALAICMERGLNSRPPWNFDQDPPDRTVLRAVFDKARRRAEEQRQTANQA